ncbi:polysaccharide deacetylase family protein [Nitratifractor sp.]
MVMTLHDRQENRNTLDILKMEPETVGATEGISGESAMDAGEEGAGGTIDSQENHLPPVSPVEKNSGKELYLTFDDGPVRGTENVLRILEEEGVEATMFLVGRHVEKHPVLYRRMRQLPNLLLANHTYSHANGHYRRFYNDSYGVMSDIEHAQILIGGERYLRLAGRNVWRLPEVDRNDGALPSAQRRNEFSKYEVIAEEGFFIYGWDVEWRFDHHSVRPINDAENLADRIERIYRYGRTARQGKVVLLAHDFMFRDAGSVEELRHFVRLMKRRGWSFRRIDRYSARKPGPLRVAHYYGKPRHDRIAGMTKKPEVRAISKSVQIRRSSAKLGAPVSTEYLKHGQRVRKSLEARLNDAVKAYRAEEVAKLVAQGANVNKADAAGRLPIHTAIRANSITLVKKLLAYGADIRLKDGSRSSALRIARTYHRSEIEKYLIEYSLAHHTAVRHIASVEKPRKRIDPLSALR